MFSFDDVIMGVYKEDHVISFLRLQVICNIGIDSLEYIDHTTPLKFGNG